MLAMAVVIILVDQIFWRPLVAWADKFKLERSTSANVPHSWLLDLLRTSRIPGFVAAFLAPVGEAINRQFIAWFSTRRERTVRPPAATRQREWIFNGSLALLVLALVGGGTRFIVSEIGLAEVGHAALMGLVTFGRVVLLLVFATLVWVPAGVAIGFHPRLARLAQPVVQFMASFPANFLFPFVTLFFIQSGISINWGGILLMALGTQWYILFNTIAGAIAIPTDLREMARNMGVRGWLLWRDLILPGIFGSWVTGGITAAGGAWNASIISELVTWGQTTLTAYGLGAFVAQATTNGDWPRIVLGVGIMSLFVVGVNRLFWRRLYALAETRFRIG